MPKLSPFLEADHWTTLLLLPIKSLDTRFSSLNKSQSHKDSHKHKKEIQLKDIVYSLKVLLQQSSKFSQNQGQWD